MGVYRPDGHFAALLDGGHGFDRLEELNAATLGGVSVLDRAAKGGFTKHVELLLARRADVDIRRKDNGFTPLLSAAEVAYTGCCRALLEHHADPNARGLDGCTALHIVSLP